MRLSMTPKLTHTEYLGVSRFKVLDGLRAIAILLVFVSHPAYPHVWERFHGASGVTLFFVLSGFLITTLLLREETRDGRPSFTSFYIRRIFRIYPMFFAVFLFYVVLILVLGMQASRRDLFVENIPYTIFLFPEHMIFFASGDAFAPFVGAWSIGIEEKFYLVWPFLGFVLLANVRRARVPVLAALAVTFFVVGLTVPSLSYLEPYQHLAYGALVAVLLHEGRSYRWLSGLGRPPVLLAIATVVVIVQFSSDQIHPMGDLYGVSGELYTLLLAGVVTTGSTWVRWLGSRPLVFIAAISYVLYLIHNFFINAAEAVVPIEWGFAGSLLSTSAAFALAVPASYLVHRFFEEPLRKYGVTLSRRTRRTPRAAVRPEVAPTGDATDAEGPGGGSRDVDPLPEPRSGTAAKSQVKELDQLAP